MTFYDKYILYTSLNERVKRENRVTYYWHQVDSVSLLLSAVSIDTLQSVCTNSEVWVQKLINYWRMHAKYFNIFLSSYSRYLSYSREPGVLVLRRYFRFPCFGVIALRWVAELRTASDCKRSLWVLFTLEGMINFNFLALVATQII